MNAVTTQFSSGRLRPWQWSNVYLVDSSGSHQKPPHVLFKHNIWKTFTCLIWGWRIQDFKGGITKMPNISFLARQLPLWHCVLTSHLGWDFVLFFSCSLDFHRTLAICVVVTIYRSRPATLNVYHINTHGDSKDSEKKQYDSIRVWPHYFHLWLTSRRR